MRTFGMGLLFLVALSGCRAADRDDPTSRTTRLNELRAQYHEKLAAVQERYANDPDSPERSREINALRSRFYAELRAAQAEDEAGRRSGPQPSVPE